MKKDFWVRIIFLFLYFILLRTSPVYANKISSNSTVKIKADRAIYFYKQHKVKFLGHVYLTKGYIRIKCREVIFFLKKDIGHRRKSSFLSASNISTKNNLEKIIAKGNVHIFLQNREGIADEVDYNLTTDIITLIGNVLLTQDNNEIKGDRLIINLGANTSEILPSKGKQVEIIFYPSPGVQGNDTHSKGE